MLASMDFGTYQVFLLASFFLFPSRERTLLAFIRVYLPNLLLIHLVRSL